MFWLSRALAFALIPILVSGLLTLMRIPKKAEKGKVALSKVVLVIGLICMTAFLIPAFITAFIDKAPVLPFVFLGFSMLGASLVVAYMNCRIWYDATGFTVKNFWGKKRIYEYREITGIKENMHECILHVGKHRVSVDEYAIGNFDFIHCANKEYNKIYSKQIPRMKKTKCDLFNGHIVSPGEFIFVYILFYVIIIALIILFAVFIWGDPVQDMETFHVSFSSYGIVDSDVVFVSDSDEEFKILNIPDEYDLSLIQSVCDGETRLTVQANHTTLKDKPPYYEVKSIYKENKGILLQSETKSFNIAAYQSYILIPIALFVLWSLFVCGSIIVGRNPHKYKRVVKLFFKPGYVAENPDLPGRHKID